LTIAATYSLLSNMLMTLLLQAGLATAFGLVLLAMF
jgi:hypothetical protein